VYKICIVIYMSTQKEKLFNKKLKDIFIGEEISGNSGHINLMNIKSQYFEDKFEDLHTLINKESKNFKNEKEFKKEVFDKLYTFMKKYFSESGSVYFSYTPLNEKVYERVYDNNEDVSLFWKTHMLYYVKTGQVWNELELEDYSLGNEEYNIKFNINNTNGELANENKKIVFNLSEVSEDTLIFNVSYTSTGYGMSKSKRDKIRRELKSDYNITKTNDEIRKLFKKFKKQNEVDYFINKNAEGFLKEQFDMWLKQYLLDDNTTYETERLNQIKSIKNISYELIEFVSKFEEELSRIWTKPKFVRNSNYVITLDRISDKTDGEEVLEKIKEHNGWQKQLEEWEKMGMIEKIDKNIFTSEEGNKSSKKDIKSLPIDTKNFDKNIRGEILGLFDNLDKSIDGRLIKSNNFHALKNMGKKYNGRAQAIYIDPPFNTNNSQFKYQDDFKDSTWLTMMRDRLSLTKDILAENGSYFVHLDYNANFLGRKLMNQIFSKNNFRNEISWSYRTGGNPSKNEPMGKKHDTILYYSKSQELEFRNLEEKIIYESDFMGETKKDDKGRYYKTVNLRDVFEGEMTLRNKNSGDFFTTSVKPVLNLSHEHINFNTQKPEGLIRILLEISTNRDDLVIDYFAGTGTTISAAHKMGRKWVGVEIGSYFDEQLLVRMKETISGQSSREPCGISDEIEWEGGGFFKYYELEQYEDILMNMSYENKTTLSQFTESWDEYMFMNEEKLAGPALSEEDGEIKVNLEELYNDIDIPETLSLLVGKSIKEITDDVVIFEDGQDVSLKNPSVDIVKPLLWWGENV